MITIKFAWSNLNAGEKLITFVALAIATLMAYQAITNGLGVISLQTIGPLVLFAFCLQSALVGGVIRGRAKAMNYVFVELMKELRDAKKKLGEEISQENMDLLAKFLGDKA